MAITSTLTANGYEVELQPKLGATAKWTPTGTGLIDPVTGGVAARLNTAPQPVLDGRFGASQPVGITRPVTSAGKMVCRFAAPASGLVGAVTNFGNVSTTLTDHTGYDASGNVTGVVPRTGIPSMLKMTPADDSSEGFTFTDPATALLEKSLAGKFGMWVYVETQPGYQAGGTPAGVLSVEMTTNASLSFANGLAVYFNVNQLKEGWNFLVFVMRNPAAYKTGSGASEAHPYGVSAQCNGTGADSDILNSTVKAIRVLYTSTGITGTNIYFDSMWTGFTAQSQAVIGFDTNSQSILDIALPKLAANGWKGYWTENANYWDGSSSRIWSDYTVLSSRSRTLYAAGWDCINHGLMHLPGAVSSPKMSTLTNAGEIAYEVMAMHNLLLSAGFTRGTEFYASPNSETSRLSEKVIRECGFKMQRHARGTNTQVTPFGIPNPSHVGAIGMGSTLAVAYSMTTSGASSGVTGLNNIARMRTLIDVMIAYGASFFLFSHDLETAGDDGSGNGTPSVTSNCMASLFTLSMDYLRDKEAAGTLRVRDGFTGFFYGVGR